MWVLLEGEQSWGDRGDVIPMHALPPGSSGEPGARPEKLHTNGSHRPLLLESGGRTPRGEGVEPTAAGS